MQHTSKKCVCHEQSSDVHDHSDAHSRQTKKNQLSKKIIAIERTLNRLTTDRKCERKTRMFFFTKEKKSQISKNSPK